VGHSKGVFVIHLYIDTGDCLYLNFDSQYFFVGQIPDVQFRQDRSTQWTSASYWPAFFGCGDAS
jgi:hypothetical protein